MAAHTIGLDMGKVRDYSALVVVERVEHIDDENRFYEDWHGDWWQEHEDHYWVRFLQRWPLGTSYPTVVEDAGRLLHPRGDYPDARLYFDATGVGQAVSDMVTDAYRDGRMGERRPEDVVITAGTEERPGYVPKVNLIATLRRLLQEDRLHVPRSLPLAHQLRAELADFTVTSTAAGRDTYGARDASTHDDLVIALALACHAYPRGEARVRLPDGYIGETYYTSDSRRRHHIGRLAPPHGHPPKSQPPEGAIP